MVNVGNSGKRGVVKVFFHGLSLGTFFFDCTEATTMRLEEQSDERHVTEVMQQLE
jgi:hypothetical protein